MKIFLAHASEDKESVRAIHSILAAQGFETWLDEIDLQPGDNWQIEIPRAIRSSDIFIACLSRKSVEKQGYIQKEFRLALDTYAEKPPGSLYLIPLKLDQVEIPDLQLPEFGVRLRDIQWLDFWKPDGVERLIKAIKRGGSKIGSAPSESKAPANEALAALARAVAANNDELVNNQLKKILWTYAGHEAMERGYIETLDEANRIPCEVLKEIAQIFQSAGERDGKFYLFKTYRRHPGEAWGGCRAILYLGNGLGYRLDECGIHSYKEA